MTRTVPDVADVLPVLPGTCRLRVDRDPDGTVLVRIAGELDCHSAQSLIEALAGHGVADSPMAFDLRRITFIDTSAYRSLHRIVEHHPAPVTVVVSSPAVERMAMLVVGADASSSWPPNKES